MAATALVLGSPAIRRPNTKGRCLRILLVEDDVYLAQLLSLILARQGHTVVASADGAKAVERLRDGWIDLVLLDLDGLDLEGTACVAVLRQQPARAQVPIAVVSASPETPALSSELGARAWLVKPLSAEDLATALRLATSDERSDGLAQ